MQCTCTCGAHAHAVHMHMHCTRGAHAVPMQCSCGARAAPARRSSCPGRCPSICTGCRSCRARPPPTARRSTTGYARSAPCLPCAARRRRAASGSASRRREAPPASAATLPWCARASRARASVRGRVLPQRPQAAAAGRRGCSWRPCCSCRPCGTSARAAARRAAARAGAAAWVWKAAESATWAGPHCLAAACRGPCAA